MFQDLDQALAYVRDHEIRNLDLKFCNLYGGWHHIGLPTTELRAEILEEGVGFDASSTPGFKTTDSGDMVLIPDLASAFVDPFPSASTLSFICDIREADTGQPYERDPRGIARRAMEHLVETGVADESRWSPEFEFYLFDEVRYSNEDNLAYYSVASGEAPSSRLDRGRVAEGTVISRQMGYHAIPPLDRTAGIRIEMTERLHEAGIDVRYHHHEVGASGQQEIEINFGPLLRQADVVMMTKYFIRMVAAANGKHATFMPKPIRNESGSGMHFHQHLFKGGEPLFFEEGTYADLSRTALSYIAGILDHTPALLALTNPSTNSYKRLVKGFEAPVRSFFSLANRKAAIRIPKYATKPHSKRIEFRPPDATCNPYLAMSAMLLAGLDGLRRELDPREMGFGPFDKGLTDNQIDHAMVEVPNLPRSLAEALDCLREDHDFLLAGGVFSEDLIRAWTSEKLFAETIEVQQRPHPIEIELYFNV